MVSVFFLFFVCVVAPKKFTRVVRERVPHTVTQGGTIPYHRFDSIDRSMHHKDPKKHLFLSVCGKSRRLVVETPKEG